MDTDEHYIRPFDWQDRVVMWGCFAAVIVFIFVVLAEGVFP